MYIFEKVGQNRDGYLHRIRKHIEHLKDEDRVDYLTPFNFVSMPPRRVPRSANQIMIDSKGYWRHVMVRYPMDQGGNVIETTEETREEGLNILKRFFLDRTYSSYPIEEDQVTLVDETDEEEDAPALDTYFTDQQIRLFMMNHIEDKDLVNTFAEQYPEMARCCWAGRHVSDWAVTLGFPL